VQVAGNILAATRCYFGCGDVGTEKIFLIVAKPRYKAKVILKTFGMLVYEVSDYNTNLVREIVLKIVTLHPRYRITSFYKSFTINNIYFCRMCCTETS